MDLIIKQRMKYAKPVEELFQAVVDPAQMTNYFISKSSGPMIAGATIMWEWADHNAKGEVQVTDLLENERIVFTWSGPEQPTTVTMQFEPFGPDITLLSITEDGWAKTDEGIKKYGGNSEGWMHFLLCLKAWMEHGINLRAGGI